MNSPGSGNRAHDPAIVAAYLSREHRDRAGKGWVMAALGEIGKQSDGIREAFTAEFKDALEFPAGSTRGADPPLNYDDAIVTFAVIVGAVALAHAISDEPLSNRILTTTAERVRKLNQSS